MPRLAAPNAWTEVGPGSTRHLLHRAAYDMDSPDPNEPLLTMSANVPAAMVATATAVEASVVPQEPLQREKRLVADVIKPPPEQEKGQVLNNGTPVRPPGELRYKAGDFGVAAVFETNADEEANDEGIDDETYPALAKQFETSRLQARMLGSLLKDKAADDKRKCCWGMCTKFWTADTEDDNASDTDDDDDDQGASQGIGFIMCIALTVVLLIVGIWLLNVKSFQASNPTGADIAGAVLVTVAATALFVGCCVGFCFCLSSCCSGGLFASSDAKDDFDPNDPHQLPTHSEWVFKRLNDDMEHERVQHDALLRNTAKPLPREAKKLLSKAKKAFEKHKRGQKAQTRDALVERVRSSLSASSSTLADDNDDVEAPPPPPPNNATAASAAATTKKTPADPAALLRGMRLRVYVLDFFGGDDSDDSAVNALREQVSLVLKVAGERDQVVVRLSSPGGSVSTYGLAASQLTRLRNAGYQLTICVDDVAASGGYLMAVVGSQICAAPFAVIGSIGVVATIPNVQRLARDKLAVDVYQFTAGKFKRTVDIVGDVTEEGKQKVMEEVGDIHDAFMDMVKIYRPALDIERVATGEAWLAVQAKNLGLVDHICTSDEYLEPLMQNADVLHVVPWARPEGGLSAFLRTTGLRMAAKGAAHGFNAVTALLSGRAPPALVQLRKPGV